MTASPQFGRRALLGTGLVAGAGSLVAAAAPAVAPAATGPVAGQVEPPPFDPTSWESVRAQFPLRSELAHFAAFVLAAHPAPVAKAVSAHRAALDADTNGYLHAEDREQAARVAAAAFLNTDPGQIALTDSTTMGTGLLCGGLRLAPGQDVVTTTHDHATVVSGLQLLAARTGAAVRRVALYDDPAAAAEAEIVSRLRAAIGPRTRVVMVTWVHSGTGVRLPIKAIADMLASVNAGRSPGDRALLCVDGVHGLAAVDVDVGDLGCDFLTAGTHKWLFGPRGTGVLWGRAWDAVTPLIPTYSDPNSPGPAATPGGYHSFEHRWALKEAFEFHSAIGRSRVAARTEELAARLKSGLAEIPGLRLITPRDPALSAGIVCCTIDGVDPGLAVATLRRDHRIVTTVTPYAEQYLRFGTSIATTPDQVDAAIAAVATLS